MKTIQARGRRFNATHEGPMCSGAKGYAWLRPDRTGAVDWVVYSYTGARVARGRVPATPDPDTAYAEALVQARAHFRSLVRIEI